MKATTNERLGASDVYSYVQEIGYGNENMSGDFSSYWMESSLEISPIEQVELLTKLQNNSFGFAPENINAVKDAICLSASDAGTFYGKTGTGRVNGQDVNGWFLQSVRLLPLCFPTCPEQFQLKMLYLFLQGHVRSYPEFLLALPV